MLHLSAVLKNYIMKIRSIGGLLLATVIPFTFNACKDEKPKPAGITFEKAEETVAESDGTTKSFHPKEWENFSGAKGATGREIKVKLILDKPVAETAVVSYTLSGTATKNSAAANGDFDIDGNNITIEKGASEAFITITLFEDFELEIKDGAILPETIILTLGSVISGPAVLGEQKIYTLSINEDDALLVLSWQDAAADMDLFLWFENTVLTTSSSAGSDPEGIFVPGGFPNGTYGMSYTYYSNSSATPANNLAFTVNLINFGGKINNGAPDADFTGNYTLSNINTYDADLETEEGHANYKGEPVIVQSIVKTGLNYTTTEIAAPASGSRIGFQNSIIKNRNQLREKKFLQFSPL